MGERCRSGAALAPLGALAALTAWAGCSEPPADDRTAADAEAVDVSASDSGVDASVPGDAGTSDGSVACSYPPGFVEPMAEGEVLAPYAWPALDGEGGSLRLDLARAPCDDDPELAWRPFEAVLFVSIPPW